MKKDVLTHRRKTGPAPLYLVRNQVRQDVVNVLEQLLRGARHGHVNGIAFAVTQPGMRFFTDVAGVCYDHPTHARGAVAALSDELAALIHGRDPNEAR